MKLLSTLTGGYRRVMDKLLSLQTETQTFVNAQFASIGFDLVLQGCAVTDNGNGTVNIAAGIVLIGGNAIRFAGANNIASDGSQAFVAGAAVSSFPEVFGDGSTKNIYSEVFATIAAQDPTNTYQIKVKTTLYNLQQYVKDQINAAEVKGTVKTIYDLDGTFLENFNTDGLGVTPAWINWALDNGNYGTPGSAGMVIIGVGTYTDPVSGLQTNYPYPSTGGEMNHTLSVAEMPAHSHQQGADVYYTVGSGGSHAAGDSGNGARGNTLSTGGGGAHNNMQPYRTAYRVVKIA